MQTFFVFCPIKYCEKLLLIVLLFTALVHKGTFDHSKNFTVFYGAEWEPHPQHIPNNSRTINNKMGNQNLSFNSGIRKDEVEYNLADLAINSIVNNCNEVYFRKHDIDSYNYLFEKNKPLAVETDYPPVLKKTESNNSFSKNAEIQKAPRVDSYMIVPEIKNENEPFQLVNKDISFTNNRKKSRLSSLMFRKHTIEPGSLINKLESQTIPERVFFSEPSKLTKENPLPMFGKRTPEAGEIIKKLATPADPSRYTIASEYISLVQKNVAIENGLTSLDFHNPATYKSGILLKKCLLINAVNKRLKLTTANDLITRYPPKFISSYIHKYCTMKPNTSMDKVNKQLALKYSGRHFSEKFHKYHPNVIASKNVLNNHFLKYVNASIKLSGSNEQLLVVPVILMLKNISDLNSNSEEKHSKLHLFLPHYEIDKMKVLLNKTFNVEIVEDTNDTEYKKFYLMRSESPPPGRSNDGIFSTDCTSLPSPENGSLVNRPELTANNAEINCSNIPNSTDTVVYFTSQEGLNGFNNPSQVSCGVKLRDTTFNPTNTGIGDTARNRITIGFNTRLFGSEVITNSFYNSLRNCNNSNKLNVSPVVTDSITKPTEVLNETTNSATDASPTKIDVSCGFKTNSNGTADNIRLETTVNNAYTFKTFATRPECSDDQIFKRSTKTDNTVNDFDTTNLSSLIGYADNKINNSTISPTSFIASSISKCDSKIRMDKIVVSFKVSTPIFARSNLPSTTTEELREVRLEILENLHKKSLAKPIFKKHYKARKTIQWDLND